MPGSQIGAVAAARPVGGGCRPHDSLHRPDTDRVDAYWPRVQWGSRPRRSQRQQCAARPAEGGLARWGCRSLLPGGQLEGWRNVCLWVRKAGSGAFYWIQFKIYYKDAKVKLIRPCFLSIYSREDHNSQGTAGKARP